MEGVHLRFGELARGGLRWSDRSEDFRTEVLGLVKAQNLKNSVIVPTGAKGGFYPKRLPDPAADRAGWLAEGIECYRIFIRGLLDLTDNLVVRRPAGEKMVTAAPRWCATTGTTTTSWWRRTRELRPSPIRRTPWPHEYGFWLGDAFASGGSVGYDHKKMGITARGAWESVEAALPRAGHGSQAQDFTVAGIGDMSGDVFGNGMLLSPPHQAGGGF